MPKLTFRIASGFSFNRRGIGFLEDENDEDLDAGSVFERMTGNAERKVRSRIDYWLQGGVHDKYFHGWPNLPLYRHCFEFRWDERRQAHRFYGFLCHPIPLSNPRFELCVLVFHEVKNEYKTDFAVLDRVNQYRNMAATTEAIARTYPEYRKEGTEEWIH